jgi:hypothetical protein
MTAFTACLQAYFTTYLTGQKSASGHTIDAYRDTFRLLLRHLNAEYGIAQDAVEFTDLGVATLTGFLSHLETKRHNSTRTRNARLAAIHSFLHRGVVRGGQRSGPLRDLRHPGRASDHRGRPAHTAALAAADHRPGTDHPQGRQAVHHPPRLRSVLGAEQAHRHPRGGARRRRPSARRRPRHR